jgi:LacI family transcriptional regulator
MSTANQSFRIAAVCPQSRRLPFWDTLINGIKRAKDEFGRFGLHVRLFPIRRPDNNEALLKFFAEMEKELVEKKYHAVVLTSYWVQALAPIIDRLVERGLVVATFNVDVPESKRHFYVGTDYYYAGCLAAELMANFVGRPAQVAAICGSKEIATYDRINGFTERLKDFPEIKLVKVVENNLDAVLNFYRTRSLIIECPQLAGIYCAGVRCESTGKEIAKQGLAGQVKLIYHDRNPEIQELLDNRIATAAILQHREEQSYLALRMLAEHFLDNKPLYIGQKILEPRIIIRGMNPAGV